jgi:hypothetical protein
MITTSIDACTDDEVEKELYLKRITIYFEAREWKSKMNSRSWLYFIDVYVSMF